MIYHTTREHVFMRYMKLVFVLIVVLALAILVGACGSSPNKQAQQYKQVTQHARGLTAYIPVNNVELNNYNKAQKLYDSPSTIIWCTTSFPNPNSPLITIPIAGKLTSSSTTFFDPQRVDDSNGSDGVVVTDTRSVDGLYHPNPPQYRYGFTPGGQYVDFFNTPTVCTTALTKITRQTTKVVTQVDPAAEAATNKAEADLKAGDKAAAQKDLASLNG